MRRSEPDAPGKGAVQGKETGSDAGGAIAAARFADAFLQAPIATVLTGLDASILVANTAFGEIVGRAPASLAGLSLVELMHGEDRHWLMGAPDPSSAAAARHDRERRYLHANGQTLEVLESAAVVSPKDGEPFVIVHVQDVTGRRAVANALQRREANLRLLVDQIPALVWTVDTELRITSGLGRHLDLLGISASDDPAVPLVDYLQTTDAEHVSILSHRRALAGERVRFEMEWFGRVFRTHVEPLRHGPGGPVVGVIGVATDVTGLKRAEENLRSGEQKFRSLAETMSAAAFIFQGARLVYSNPAAQEITGFSAEELEGMSFWDVIHPLDVDLVRQRGLQRQRGEAVPSRYEVRIVTKSNEERWVDYTGGSIQFEGQPAVLGTAFDITERKRAETALRQSEERFRAIFEKSPLGLAVIDRDEKLIDANDALSRMTGFGKEEIRGLTVQDASHAAELAQNLADLHHLVSQQLPFLQRERRLVRKNGEVGWFRLAASAVRDPDGAPSYWVIMVEDITDQRRSEAAAREHQAELSRVLRVRSLGELAAGLAHELNQPLAAVVSFAKGCVHRIRAGDLEASELVGKLDQIADEALRAGSIIRWVQRFLRKEAPRREPTELAALIANIVRLVESEARQRGIDVRVCVDPAVPPIPVEAVQIEQVLFNLVRNGFDALAASSAEGAVIEISAEVIGENVDVRVRDNGPGLGPGDPERIFEPFYSSKSEGMGLGLSISRSIVEAHGGHLVLSQTGVDGTTFRFSLPTTPSADE